MGVVGAGGEGAERPSVDEVEGGASSVGGGEADVHELGEVAREIKMGGEEGVGGLGAGVARPDLERLVVVLVLHPGGDGPPCPEVDPGGGGVLGDEGEDGVDVDADVVVVDVAQVEVESGVELYGDDGVLARGGGGDGGGRGGGADDGEVAGEAGGEGGAVGGDEEGEAVAEGGRGGGEDGEGEAGGEGRRRVGDRVEEAERAAEHGPAGARRPVVGEADAVIPPGGVAEEGEVGGGAGGRR